MQRGGFNSTFTVLLAAIPVKLIGFRKGDRMVGEALAAFAGFNHIINTLKNVMDISDAAKRSAAIIDVQAKVLEAQQHQLALTAKMQAMEAELRRLNTWEAERQRYELRPVADGVQSFSYVLKEGSANGEPQHAICPQCYQQASKSILVETHLDYGRAVVTECNSCGWHAYIHGQWHPEHLSGPKARSRKRT